MIRCDKTKTVHFLCWMTASIAITMIFLSRSTMIACVIYYVPLLSRLARNMTDSPWGFGSAFDQGLREIEWNWMKLTYLWISQLISTNYLRAAAPAADPGRIGKPSERIYGTGLHPPPKKKWGKDVPGIVLHALLPVMVFMLKGNVRSLVLMFFVMYVVRHFW